MQSSDKNAPFNAASWNSGDYALLFKGLQVLLKLKGVAMKMTISAVMGIAISLMLMPAVQARSPDTVGSCKIHCDREMAQCEKSSSARSHCPRKRTQCEQACIAPPKQDLLSKSNRRQLNCEQKCDMGRTSCDRANPTLGEQCDNTRKNCITRCK
jgi:hypothetical protein